MSLFGKAKMSGIMDEIRCDEPSYLIWKWHPVKSEQGNYNRENSIRWGSSLRVREGEAAVFVYMQEDGTMRDFFLGPYDEILNTKNLPVLANIIGLAYDGATPFQAEVYFINLAQIVQVKFGVPFFDVYDPRFLDYSAPVAVRGTITFKIKDYREFIKMHKLRDFNLDEFQKQIRDAVTRYVKDVVANAPTSHNIPLIQIESKISQINDTVELFITDRLKENFGVSVSGVDINAIELDKSSEGYKQLMSITKDVTAAKIQAETSDYVERIRIRREEEQYAQHKQSQTSNIGAFQVEKQAEVGIAGAEALGQMGSSSSGSVNLGGEGTIGFNPAAMMAGVALGGAVGQNIAGTMNNTISGINQPTQNGVVPPPIPTTGYHVAVNGQPTGPFDMNALALMASVGQLNADSLVWKVGMAQWVKAGTVDELKKFLVNSIPPIPPNL